MAESQKADIKALMETPEVKAALMDAAKAGAAAAVAEMAKAKGEDIGVDGATELLSRLALAIGEIGDQGTQRKRVAPEILAQRAKAQTKLDALVAECQHEVTEARHAKAGLKPNSTEWAQQDNRERKFTPEYRVIGKVYFGERIIEPYRSGGPKGTPPVPTEIAWFGEPNDALRPLNKIAEELYFLFKESRGSTERLKSIKHRDGAGNVGIVVQDTRPYSVTAGGLVIRGELPHRVIAAEPTNDGEFGGYKDNNDPNALEVRVLGTLAAPARKNFADANAVAPRSQP
jgi:hypothetical protein